jgi:hypothetical protein
LAKTKWKISDEGPMSDDRAIISDLRWKGATSEFIALTNARIRAQNPWNGKESKKFDLLKQMLLPYQLKPSDVEEGL